MITLSRLDGEPFALNEDMIERVEPHADTTIFTISGNVYTVRESSEQVIAAIRSEKATILRSAASPVAGSRLRVLEGGDSDGPGGSP